MRKDGKWPPTGLGDLRCDLGVRAIIADLDDLGSAVFIFSNGLLTTLGGSDDCCDRFRSRDARTPDRIFALTPLDREIESFFREFFVARSEGVNGIFEEVWRLNRGI